MHDGDLHPRVRFALTVEGSAQPGAGTTAEQSDLPRAPRNVAVKIGDAMLTPDWEPVSDAVFDNIYYDTTRDVPNAANHFHRLQYERVGMDRFQTVISATRQNAI